MCTFLAILSSVDYSTLQYLENNLNLRIRTKSVLVEAGPTEYVWFLGQLVYQNKNWTIASTPQTQASLIIHRLGLTLGKTKSSCKRILALLWPKTV